MRIQDHPSQYGQGTANSRPAMTDLERKQYNEYFGIRETEPTPTPEPKYGIPTIRRAVLVFSVGSFVIGYALGIVVMYFINRG